MVIKINNKKILILLLSIFILIFSINNITSANYNINIESNSPYYSSSNLNKDGKNFEINFIGYGTVGNNSINSKYLSQHLDEENKDDILSNIENNGELIVLGNGIQNINIRYKNLTFFTGIKEIGLASIPKDAIELLLKGNEIGKKYELEGTKAELALYNDTGFSYSFKNQKLANQFNSQEVRLIGTLHYLKGAIAKLNGEGSFTLNYKDTITGSGIIQAEYAKKATGYSLDFGLNTKVNDKLYWSFLISNIGAISTDKASYYEYSYDPEVNKFKETTDQKLDNLKYSLPMKINFGTKYRWKDNTNLIGSYSLTKYNTDHLDHRISGEIVYNKIKFLPVSIGATYSTLQNDLIFSSGVVLKLGSMHTKVIFSDLQSLFNGSKSVSLGISSRFSF